MLIAVPSDAPGGLEAKISEHFGHCDVFTLVEVEDQEVGEVTLIKNGGHEEGGCLAPVTLLKEKGAETMITGGMGKRPLAGFEQAGITVHHKGAASTVNEAIYAFLSGQCPVFGEENTCGGHGHGGGHGGGGGGGCGHDHGGGGCGHHHHEPVQRETVDGPVEKDRVVAVSYKLKDTEGNLLDAAEGITYLHGHGHIVPGLEQAMEGHVAGDTFEVNLTPENGYGERDESKKMEVPIDQLPPGIKVGDMLQAQAPNGAVMPLTVASLDDEQAIMDANHPLAGETLTFEVEVLAVLEATEEELSHGHVH